MGVLAVHVGQKHNVHFEDIGGFTYLKFPTAKSQSAHVEEALFLGWLLVLYRLADGSDVDCTAIVQQTNLVGKRSRRAIELCSNGISLRSSNSVSTTLESVRHTVPKEVLEPNSTYNHDNDKLLWLYDVAIPDANIQEDLSPDEINNVSVSRCREQFNDYLINADIVVLDLGMKWNIMLEIQIKDNHLWLRPWWHSRTATEYMARHHMQSFRDILETVLSDGNISIRKALDVTKTERMQIWEWNQDLPPLVSTCMQDLITERARSQPSATAICAWDGELSYQQVDDYSTFLASHLVSLGLRVGDIVPLCFEKSRWTVVAVLAVMKAGGAIALMDPDQPLGRRQTIVEQVNAQYIIVSAKQAPFASIIAPGAQVVTVSLELLDALATLLPSPNTGLPVVPPNSTLYIIFTSGSTGKPKGVVISHETYTSSAIPRSNAVGYEARSRVLDFASYAFDVSVDSMLCTLLQGGCLCIPSVEDRMNDLSGAIRRFGITMANLTPSVARILDDDIIPSLSSLGLGGESVSTGDLETWGAMTRIVIGYGPSECTVGCTINASAAGKPYVSIGQGNGAVIWVVDPDNHNRLMPIGAVGELLVEGPIVGQGYLNDPEKTAAAFIEDPEFLLNGAVGYPGRRGRLYKTGDLVRYDPDGLKGFVFVGRKDTQVKLRGQRVELGEIEHNMRVRLPVGYQVAAEVIAPNGKAKESMLVAFIAEHTIEREISESDVHSKDETWNVEFSSEANLAIATMSAQLSEVLPIYMIPSAYIGLNRMPMLVSGKQDRKSLRSLGARIPLKDFVQPSSTSTQSLKPSTREEICLQKAWSRLLGIPENQIDANQNFFSLGGESIMAMKLVAIAREDGFQLTVADILGRPRLSAMAQAMQAVNIDPVIDIPPFSLLPAGRDREDACVEAARVCAVNRQSIEDIYPCTSLQEILIAFSTWSTKGRFAQRVAEVRSVDHVTRLKAAWESVFADCPILRTRVMDFGGRGFMQVVINENIEWGSGNDLNEFLEADQQRPMTLGTPLVRFSIVTDRPTGKFYFVWTIHHALYDGWSTDLMLERVRAAYDRSSLCRPVTMKHYIRYFSDSTREASRDYWRIQLEGATAPQFPSLPQRAYFFAPDASEERYIPLKRLNNSSLTIGTLIRAALALVISQYTMADDVVFGETFTGRQLPIPHIEQIEGPTIVTVPSRIRIDRSAPIQQFLQGIQEQGLARIPHEHLGMQNIRLVSADAKIACDVMTGLIIQPGQNGDSAKSNSDEFPAFPIMDAAREAIEFNSYPLMVACSLQQEGFSVITSFDSNLITVRQMQRFLAQLESTVQQLAREESVPVAMVNNFGEHDLQDLLYWTWESPDIIKEDVQPFLNFLETVEVGDAIPIYSGSWIVSATDNEQLVPIGAIGELAIEIGPSSIGQAKNPESMIARFAEVSNRSGTLYQTGKLVRYTDDGIMRFVGSKETRFSLNGQVFDLAMADATIRQLLPSTSQISVNLVESAGSSNKVVVVFINEVQERTWDSRLRDFPIEIGDSTLKVSRTISETLADALIGIDKLLSDVLPPHMIPSCYIPISEITDVSGFVTKEIILQSRIALANLRAGKFSMVSLSTKEHKLREMWARILGLDELAISLDDNFFRLGGDSIMGMKLVSTARQEGFKLSLTDIFRSTHLAEMASLLHEDDAHSNEQVNSPKPFSLLGVTDILAFVYREISPLLADARWQIQDVLPATDPQSRDVDTTITAPRSAVEYNMFYMPRCVDKNRLLQCCQQLVSQHEILRTVFVKASNSYLQVVIRQLDILVTERETDGDLAEFCERLSASDIEDDSEFSLGRSFLRFFFIQGTEENCLMIRISHAQYDGLAFTELIRQLQALYNGEVITPAPPFSAYLGQLASIKEESIQYWRQTLQGSSLTTISTESQSTRAVLVKKAVNISTHAREITTATMLSAAWALVLSRYLSTPDVVFGGVVAGRMVDLPEADRIMGPCYQYCPIRVKHDSTWSYRDLLEFVQNQYAESARFEHLGFQEIARQCTTWPSNIPFFDSIVHHEDIDYFETISLGGSTCRLDCTNPHPESAQPMRVVSFPDDGQLGIGIILSESLEEFGKDRLDELCDVFTRFIEQPEAKIW